MLYTKKGQLALIFLKTSIYITNEIYTEHTVNMYNTHELKTLNNFTLNTGKIFEQTPQHSN